MAELRALWEQKKREMEALEREMESIQRQLGESQIPLPSVERPNVAVERPRARSYGRLSKSALPEGCHLNKADIQLQSVVGRGSFGMVWKALFQGKVQVAVKLFLYEDVETEIVMLARIKVHPNVLNFLGVIFEMDDPYKEPQVALVTKYMAGGSLYDLLVDRGSSHFDKMVRFSFAKMVGLAAQAAAGISHLHACGIIHRDLACRNLLVDDATPMTVAVADFGFARLRAKSEQGGFSSSKTGPVRWEAPESLRLKQYSEATDAFMFGVCMWEMVAGRVPWAPLSTAAAAHAVLSGERLKIPKNCDYQLGQLILQCWLEDPTARPKLSDAYEALRRRSHELMEEAQTVEEEVAGVRALVQGQLLQKVALVSGAMGAMGAMSRELFGRARGVRLDARRVQVTNDLRRLKWIRSEAQESVKGAVKSILGAAAPTPREDVADKKSLALAAITDVVLGFEVPVNLGEGEGPDPAIAGARQRAFTLVTSEARGGRMAFVCPNVTLRDSWVKALRFLVGRLRGTPSAQAPLGTHGALLQGSAGSAVIVPWHGAYPTPPPLVRYAETPPAPPTPLPGAAAGPAGAAALVLQWKAVDAIKRGSFFLKFARSSDSSRPHERFLRLSADCRELMWEGLDNSLVRRETVKSVSLAWVGEMRCWVPEGGRGRERPVALASRADDESDSDLDASTVESDEPDSPTVSAASAYASRAVGTFNSFDSAKRPPAGDSAQRRRGSFGSQGGGGQGLEGVAWVVKQFRKARAEDSEDEADSEARAEARAETRNDAKGEVRSEARGDSKTESKAEEPRPRRLSLTKLNTRGGASGLAAAAAGGGSGGTGGGTVGAAVGWSDSPVIQLYDRSGALLIHLVAPNRGVFELWSFGLDVVIRDMVEPTSLAGPGPSPIPGIAPRPQRRASRTSGSHSASIGGSLEPIPEGLFEGGADAAEDRPEWLQGTPSPRSRMLLPAAVEPIATTEASDTELAPTRRPLPARDLPSLDVPPPAEYAAFSENLSDSPFPPFSIAPPSKAGIGSSENYDGFSASSF